MIEIPDPIERLEAWEDRMCYEYGLPDGGFKCAGCGATIELGSCYQAGAAPYGVPVCKICCKESRLEEGDDD